MKINTAPLMLAVTSAIKPEIKRCACATGSPSMSLLASGVTLPVREYDALMTIYRRWLVFGTMPHDAR